MNPEEPVVIVTEPSRRTLLTVPEYADQLRVHPRTVYRWISEGTQRGVVRAGRHLRIDPSIARCR